MKHLKFQRRTPDFLVKHSFSSILFEWGKAFCEKGLINQIKGGSLSYRHGLGFVITARDSNLGKLDEKDLIFVEEWDFSSNRFIIRGNADLPAESIFHAIVYQNRSGAIFSFFIKPFQILEMVERLGLSPSKTSELSEIEEKLSHGNIIAIQDQGILSFGCTAEDAGSQLFWNYGHIRKL